MITVVKPLMNLHRAGRISARIVLESQAGRKRHRLGRRDRLLPQHRAAARARCWPPPASRGTPLIYDLDDNLFELPPDCEGLSREREASRQAMLEEYLRAAALVRVYSQPLARRVAALNPRVVQIFAPVDLSLVPPLRAKRRPPGPIKIVYATSRTQDAMCEIFLPALARIASRYAGRVEVHFWGCRPPAGCRPAERPSARPGLPIRPFPAAFFPLRIRYRPGPLAGRGFLSLENQQQVPRVRRQRHCRHLLSHTRSIPNRVEHEVSGLLVANDAESWHDAIVRLIEDESLRTRIQRQARQYVREHYAQEKFERLFLEQIRGVLEAVRRPSRAASAPAAGPSALPGFFPAGWSRRGGRWARCGDWGRGRPGPRSAGSSATAASPPGSAGSL